MTQNAPSPPPAPLPSTTPGPWPGKSAALPSKAECFGCPGSLGPLSGLVNPNCPPPPQHSSVFDPFHSGNPPRAGNFPGAGKGRGQALKYKTQERKGLDLGTVGGRMLSQPQCGWACPNQAGWSAEKRMEEWMGAEWPWAPARSCGQPARTETSGPQLPRTELCQPPVGWDGDPTRHL